MTGLNGSRVYSLAAGSDDGFNPDPTRDYRSTVHTEACRELSMRHLFTRPHRPRTDGKAERFIQTLTNGRAYGAIYGSSVEGTAAPAGGPTTTTSGDDTAPSATCRPQLGSPSWNNLVASYD
jgi:hypothetical protein